MKFIAMFRDLVIIITLIIAIFFYLDKKQQAEKKEADVKAQTQELNRHLNAICDGYKKLKDHGIDLTDRSTFYNDFCNKS